VMIRADSMVMRGSRLVNSLRISQRLSGPKPTPAVRDRATVEWNLEFVVGS